jgi:hypothetical protein
LLEQDKSAQQNPISDWADDLWKTIARWLIAINAGDIDPASTTFRLYVTPVHEGGSLETKPNARKAAISKTFEISIEFPPI